MPRREASGLLGSMCSAGSLSKTSRLLILGGSGWPPVARHDFVILSEAGSAST